ncbi:MAG TPA: hypothetical protein VMT22_08000 [Terriglobales bacterium]|jgi:hypothetical protein|nr:hypothetical protein [Terriglobales bacterium]
MIWIVAGLFAAGTLWWAAADYLIKPDPRSVRHLRQVADEINRSVPVMIDKETELMPSTVYDGMLVYNYRLVSYSVSQIDPRKFAAGVKQKVTQAACNRPETRDEFLKNGVTLRYAYFDKNNKHIATVDITPADCGF